MPAPLHAFLTSDKEHVVLLPETFAGHAGLVASADIPSTVPVLTSPTPEPLTSWRDQILADEEYLGNVVYQAQIHSTENDLRSDRWYGRTVAKAKATLGALDNIRADLDHLAAMLPPDADEWNAWHHEMAAKLRPLVGEYKNIALGVYGTSFPLDGETQTPVVPADLREHAGMEDFPLLEDGDAHEADGVSLHVAAQRLNGYMGHVHGMMPELGFAGEDIGALCEFCAEYGVFPQEVETADDNPGGIQVAGHQQPFALDPPTRFLTILGPIAMTIVGLIFAAQSAESAAELSQETKNTVRWADRAGRCVAKGNDPADCALGERT